MQDRLLGSCFAVLASAAAIYVAVRLIESIAATLVVSVAVIGGLVLLSVVTRLLWRRRRIDRW